MTGKGGGLASRPPNAGEDYFGSDEGTELLARIADLNGPRILVAVAGAPGSGKSVLAQAMVNKLPDTALVPMDGFHLDDQILDARGLRSRKGAVETFDVDGFAALVTRLAVPRSEVIFPVFDRSRELAVSGAGVVTANDRIVVIEGNYLLLNQSPWDTLTYDLTVWLYVPEVELTRRLTERWRGYGMDQAEVDAHLDNDLANARFVSRHSRAGDVSILQAGSGSVV